MADVFEVLTASESEQKIAKQAAADTLSAAVYDVREKFGAHLFCAKSKEEFHDRLALCKDDMMKTVNGHLMPVTGVMRRICKTMEREWKQKVAEGQLNFVYDEEEPDQDYEKFFDRKKSPDHKNNPNVGSWPEKKADNTGPDQNIQETFSPSDGPLVPSGDFAAYLNSVDQGAPAQVQRDFEAAKGKKSEDNDYGSDFDRQFGGYEEGGWRDSLDGMIDSVKLRDRSKESRRRTANEEEGWDTEALQRDYSVEGFSAPYVVVRRKSDGQRGTLEFNRGSKYTGEPRIYRNFVPHTAAFHRMAIDGTGGVPAATPAQPAPAPGSGGNMSVGGGGNVNMSPPGFNLPDSGNGSSDVMDNGQGIQGGASMVASVVKRYAQWCVDNLARPSTKTLEYYAANRPDQEYFVLTSALQRHAAAANPFAPKKTPVTGMGGPGKSTKAPKAPGSSPIDPDAAKAQGIGGVQSPVQQLKANRRHAEVPGQGGMAPAPQPVGKYDPNGNIQPVSPTALPGASQNTPPSDWGGILPPQPIDLGNLSYTGSRRNAGSKDYLQQADEAITNLLNEKAQEFQEGIQPLQQALQTIQYAQQVQQAQNPMNVMPPAGTVNVLPQGQAPEGPAPAGVDPSGGVDPAVLQQLMGMGGMDPSAAGGAPQGDPSQQSGPPPAAAEQGAVPPEMAQQIQARRRRHAWSEDDDDLSDYYERQAGGEEWDPEWDKETPSASKKKGSRRRTAGGRHQELSSDGKPQTRSNGQATTTYGQPTDENGETTGPVPFRGDSYKGKHREDSRRNLDPSEKYALPPTPGARVRDERGVPTFEDGDYEYFNDHNYDVRDQAAVDYGDHSNGLSRAKGLTHFRNTPKEEVEYYTDDLGRSIAVPYEGKHWLPGQPEDVDFVNNRRPQPGEDGQSYEQIMREMERGKRSEARRTARRGGGYPKA